MGGRAGSLQTHNSSFFENMATLEHNQKVTGKSRISRNAQRRLYAAVGKHKIVKAKAQSGNSDALARPGSPLSYAQPSHTFNDTNVHSIYRTVFKRYRWHERFGTHHLRDGKHIETIGHASFAVASVASRLWKESGVTLWDLFTYCLGLASHGVETQRLMTGLEDDARSWRRQLAARHPPDLWHGCHNICDGLALIVMRQTDGVYRIFWRFERAVEANCGPYGDQMWCGEDLGHIERNVVIEDLEEQWLKG